jgi:hypothetical protein
LPVSNFIEPDFVTIAKNDEGVVWFTSIKFGMGSKMESVVIFELRFDRLATKFVFGERF